MPPEVTPKAKRKRSPRKPRDPNTSRKVSIPQQIIIKLVAGMRGCSDPSIWKNEMRICSLLRKKYGDEFLLWVTPLEGHKFNSLIFYLTALGKGHLSDQLVQFEKFKGSGIILQPTTVILEKEKLAEDVVSYRQPRTLKEFLQYGKNLANTPNAS